MNPSIFNEFVGVRVGVISSLIRAKLLNKVDIDIFSDETYKDEYLWRELQRWIPQERLVKASTLRETFKSNSLMHDL